MLELYIDPYVFACPKSAVTEDEADAFVERLLLLRDLLKNGLIEIFVSDQSADTLETTGSYPIGDRTQRFSHQQRRDVLGVVQKLLSSRTVETVSGVEDVVVEGPVCSPTMHLARRPLAFIYQYHRLHAIIGLCTGHAGKPVMCPAVFTTDLPDGLAMVRALGAVPVWVQNTEYKAPTRYEVEVLNLSDAESVISTIDPVSEWRAGRVALAIALAVAKQGGRFQPENEREWCVGNQFVEAADQYGFMHENGKISRLLNACVDSVLGNGMRAVHELRVGRGGNDPQRTRRRDGGTAWRRDIDDEFHLHYWRSANGVELASVVVHNNFGIPE